MANSHEKADVIIVNEVMSAARRGYSTIHIVCDDRLLMCLLLVYVYTTVNISSE